MTETTTLSASAQRQCELNKIIQLDIVKKYVKGMKPTTRAVEEFHLMLEKNHIELSRNVVGNLDQSKLKKMIDIALSLDPLWENALGPDWKNIMTRAKAEELFLRM